MERPRSIFSESSDDSSDDLTLGDERALPLQTKGQKKEKKKSQKEKKGKSGRQVTSPSSTAAPSESGNRLEQGYTSSWERGATPTPQLSKRHSLGNMGAGDRSQFGGTGPGQMPFMFQHNSPQMPFGMPSPFPMPYGMGYPALPFLGPPQGPNMSMMGMGGFPNQFPRSMQFPTPPMDVYQYVDQKIMMENAAVEDLKRQLTTLQNYVRSGASGESLASQPQRREPLSPSIGFPSQTSGGGFGPSNLTSGYHAQEILAHQHQMPPNYNFMASMAPSFPPNPNAFTVMRERENAHAHHKNKGGKKKKKEKYMKKTSRQSCKPDVIDRSTTTDDSDDGGKRHTETMKRGRHAGYLGSASSTFPNPNIQPQGGSSKNSSSNKPAQNMEGIDQEQEQSVGIDAKMEPDNSDLAEFNKAAKFYQAGRKNNVWQRIVDEEHVKEAAEQLDMITMIDKFVVHRGPESYVVGNKRKRKALDVAMDAELAGEEDVYATDSSLSSACFSDSTKNHLKTLIIARSTGASKKLEKDRLTGQKILEEKIATMDDHSLAYFIGKTLREREDKRYLFVRAMNVFGREYMLKTFLKTLKVERLGGILTKSKKRRRTPGGVFLYLIRMDERLNQADRDSVFAWDKQEELEAKRIDKAYQKQKMFESMASNLILDYELDYGDVFSV